MLVHNLPMTNKLFLLALLVSAPLFAQEESEVTPVIDESEAQPIETTPVTTEVEEPVIKYDPEPVFTGQTETPVLTTEVPREERDFNPRKSHWLTSFGFEGLKYEIPVEYDGVQEDFQTYDQELWGGRLGFGGELYLGAGFNLTTKVESFYVGTLFARVLNAGPEDEAQEFAYIKKTGNVWGAEASQSLGFMFDFKTKNPFMDEWAYLTVEPFVEAGLGRAWAYNRVSYDYNTGASGTDEGFRQRIRDELTSVKFGGGINFTANSGFFLYVKAFTNNFDILERKTTTYTRPNQGAGTTVSGSSKDVKIDPITTYAIGGGYKF
jgi:hypothetical protein